MECPKILTFTIIIIRRTQYDYIEVYNFNILLLLPQILLHINLSHLNLYVFIVMVLIPAHPHLNVISGGLLQLPVEPWRAVKRSALSCISAAIHFPQSDSTTFTIVCITEIVSSALRIFIVTRTGDSTKATASCSKCPYMW